MKALLTLLFLPLMACSSQEQAPELGTVQWQSDHDKALALSAQSGKPIFLLFQEVPG